MKGPALSEPPFLRLIATVVVRRSHRPPAMGPTLFLRCVLLMMGVQSLLPSLLKEGKGSLGRIEETATFIEDKHPLLPDPPFRPGLYGMRLGNFDFQRKHKT